MKQRLSNRLKILLKEAHRPERSPILGHRSLGNLKRRSGAMQSVANQDMKDGARYDSSGTIKHRFGVMQYVANQNMKGGARYDATTKGLAEEAIKKVKAKVETEKQRQTGKTDTGSKPEKVETELVQHPLIGPI